MNSQRLSNANEESQPAEVSSGDVVQFGVDVIENSRRVTHGCIVATLKLFMPDGSEALKEAVGEMDMAGGFPSRFDSNGDSGHNIANITTLNLLQLAQCLKEALNREEALQGKIQQLQDILIAAQESAETSWRSLVEEERLLSRIESLQYKLEAVITNSSNKPTDELVVSLRSDLLKLHDERELFETAAKESIQRANEQMMLTASKVAQLEVSLNSANDQVSRLKEEAESTSAEASNLADKLDGKVKEMEELTSTLECSEEKVRQLNDGLQKEKCEYDEKLADWSLKVEELEAVIKSLEFKNESLHIKVDDLQSELDRLIALRNESPDNVMLDGNQDIDNHHDQTNTTNLTEQLYNSQNELATTKLNNSQNNSLKKALILNIVSNVDGSVDREEASNKECCRGLRSQLDELREEVRCLRAVRDEEREDDEDEDDENDHHGLDLMQQLLSSQRQVATSGIRISELTNKISDLEARLKDQPDDGGFERSPSTPIAPQPNDSVVPDRIADDDKTIAQLKKTEENLRREMVDLNKLILSLKQVSEKQEGDFQKQSDILTQQLLKSQQELTTCKLQLGEFTQQIDRLEAQVIISRGGSENAHNGTPSSLTTTSTVSLSGQPTAAELNQLVGDSNLKNEPSRSDLAANHQRSAIQGGKSSGDLIAAATSQKLNLSTHELPSSFDSLKGTVTRWFIYASS